MLKNNNKYQHVENTYSSSPLTPTLLLCVHLLTVQNSYRVDSNGGTVYAKVGHYCSFDEEQASTP